MKLFHTTFAALALLIGGCASDDYTDGSHPFGGLNSKYVYLGYEGPIKAAKEVGIITTSTFTRVRKIDGINLENFRAFKSKGLNPQGRFQLHLEPGVHVIKFYFLNETTRPPSFSLEDIPIFIEIKAGQVIHCDVEFGKQTSPPPSLRDSEKPSFLSMLGNKTRYMTWWIKQTDGSKAFATIEHDFRSLAKAN